MKFITALCFLISFACGEETLKFAAVLFRHGDRTPVDPCPTDPWRNESLWPVKFGELTNTGKIQHYALGKWFRDRYSTLISDQFDPAQIYVRSTDVDRTLMSAQANLAGMYPPVGKSVWNDQLMWQPIPIHTVPEKEDEVLAMKKHCPAYSNEYEHYKHSKAYKEKLSQYEDLMDYLTAYTGRKIKDFNDINYIYHNLYIETLYNFTLPNWTRSVYPDKLLEPSGFSFTTATATPTLARLKAGPLIREITSKMGEVAEANDTLRLSVYSAHDDTVANVLNALGMFDAHCPPYTATVLFELFYDNTTDVHFIRIYYRNSTEIVAPHLLRVPYCGETCPLERFQKLYDNLINVDWEYECGKQFSSLLGMAFFFGIGIIMAVYGVHRLHFARMARQNRYGFVYTGVAPPPVANNKTDLAQLNTV